MDLLLREYIPATGAFADRELTADEITIGCGNDQLIQVLGLDIALEHAVLSMRRDALSIKATTPIVVDEERVRTSTLAVGSQMRIGGHSFRVVDAPAGFDAALELTPDPDVDPATFEGAFRTDLTDTWLSKRSPAWVTGAAVLILGFFVPLALILDDDEGTPAEDAVVLTDAYWTSGPLHAVHNVAIGDDCGACHAVPFQKVQDDACATCHSAIVDHVPADLSMSVANATERCAVCHVEHNEPEFLVVEADGLCVDCHAAPEQLHAGMQHMAAVQGFDIESHPPFEVAMLTPAISSAGSGIEIDWELTETVLSGAQESSFLKFPHALHLDPDSVQTGNEGRGMQCVDCHTLTADDEHFEPVTMQAHCQDCHELTFDPSSPQRQLPHGQPIEIIQVMEGHFARLFADPERRDGDRPRRRRPDRSQASACSDGVLECALARTRQEVANQFAVRGCVTCHAVEDTGIDDLYTRYQVYPIRLSRDFMPTAVFDHRSHLTQEDAQGDDACLTCHEASTSESSSDVLIPGISNCTQCHSDGRRADTVPLVCIDCHQYHPSDAHPIRYMERHL